MTEKRPAYETGRATLDDARDSVGRYDRLFDYVLDRLERLARRLEAWKKSLTSWTAEDSSEPQREKARGEDA